MILTSIIFLNNNMGRVGSKLVCYTAVWRRQSACPQLEDLDYGVPLSVKKPNIVIFAPNG